jgi:hypothetical protein
MNFTNPSKPAWRAAVNAMCKSCIYDPAEGGTWRQQAALCTVSECPIWAVRPVSRGHKALTDADLGPHEMTSTVIARAAEEVQ